MSILPVAMVARRIGSEKQKSHFRCAGEAQCARPWQGVLRQEALPTARVVDTTGSGDALTSGFLAAYWRTGDIAHAARWGAANAASVLAQMGSQTGLRTAAELAEIVTKKGDLT